MFGTLYYQSFTKGKAHGKDGGAKHGDPEKGAAAVVGAAAEEAEKLPLLGLPKGEVLKP